MLNLKRKILGSSLAVVLTVTTVMGSGLQTNIHAKEVQNVYMENAQVDETESNLTVHCKGANLTEAPNIYLYGGGDAGQWPGAKMQSEGNGWYVYQASVKSSNIVINGSWGQDPQQGVDLKKSGECWYLDGKWYDYNPEGDTTPAPTSNVTNAPVTPDPKDEIVSIKSLSVKNGDKIKTNAESIISVDAASTTDIIFYKYEVFFNDNYVGEHYYSKSATYKFVPTQDGEYTIKVSAQAHNEANTTVQETVKINASDDGIVVTDPPITMGPDPTPTPTMGIDDPTPTPTMGIDDPTPTPTTGTTPTPTPTPIVTLTPTPTTGTTPTPTPTQKPTSTPTPTPKVTPTPTPKVTPTPTPNDGWGDDDELTVALKVNKKSPQKESTSISLRAVAEGGAGDYKYRFYTKDSQGNRKILNGGFKKAATCTWKPTKAGEYRIYVEVKDADDEVVVKSVKYTITKKLAASVTLSKKSPQKVKKVIKITAKSSGTQGKVRYKIYVKDSKGKKKILMNFSQKKTVNWKPTKAGNYEIVVQVKDGTGKTASKVVSYKIKK